MNESEQKIQDTLRSAERLELTKKDFQAMVDNLSDLRRRVQFIDPNIREVFLELNHRIRHAEKLVERLDGKIGEKNRSVFLQTVSE